MEDKIRIDWVKLSEDAFNQTAFNFSKAIDIIDGTFGKGYSKSHPELIGSFLQACSTELNGTTIGMCILDLQEALKEIAENISEINLNNE